MYVTLSHLFAYFGDLHVSFWFFFFKLLFSTFITKYCLHSYFGGWKWDCNLCDDAGDRSSGWHAYPWSCNFIFISSYVYSPCTPWSAWLCRSSAGMYLLKLLLNMYCVCLVNWITMRQLFKFTGICLCLCVCYHHREEIDVWSSIVFKLKIKCAGYPYKERTDVPFYLCLSEWFNIIFYFCLSFFQYEGYVAFFRDKIYFVRAKLIFVWTILQGACVKKLSGEGKLEDNRATKQIVALLSAPLDKYNDIVTVLKLSNYPSVMEYVDSETNKVMAMVIIQSIMKNNTQISTADKVGFCPLYIYIHISSYALF